MSLPISAKALRAAPPERPTARRRAAEPAKRRELSHAMQRFVAKDMLWCNTTGSPYFQAARDYVKGYHFMNQLYVYWDTTWLDKKA